MDPQSGNVLPVGGTHTDPITGLPIAIELGGLMLDPYTKIPVPIVAACIDPESGDVLPVGEKSFLWFDSVTEQLSGRVSLLHTAGADSDERLWPCPGGMAGYTTARVLTCETKLRSVLDDLNQQVNSAIFYKVAEKQSNRFQGLIRTSFSSGITRQASGSFDGHGPSGGHIERT